jgi:hypothetical protein
MQATMQVFVGWLEEIPTLTSARSCYAISKYCIVQIVPDRPSQGSDHRGYHPDRAFHFDEVIPRNPEGDRSARATSRLQIERDVGAIRVRHVGCMDGVSLVGWFGGRLFVRMDGVGREPTYPYP